MYVFSFAAHCLTLPLMETYNVNITLLQNNYFFLLSSFCYFLPPHFEDFATNLKSLSSFQMIFIRPCATLTGFSELSAVEPSVTHTLAILPIMKCLAVAFMFIHIYICTAGIIDGKLTSQEAYPEWLASCDLSTHLPSEPGVSICDLLSFLRFYPGYVNSMKIPDVK